MLALANAYFIFTIPSTQAVIVSFKPLQTVPRVPITSIKTDDEEGHGDTYQCEDGSRNSLIRKMSVSLMPLDHLKNLYFS